VLQPTLERESLCGSAFKLQASIEAAAGRPRDELRAIAGMKRHFEHAEQLARDSRHPDFFYTAMNRIAADLALYSGRRGWKGLDPVEVAAVRESLTIRVRDDPDFWSVVALTELRLYEALASGGLAEMRASIEEEYEDLHVRVSAPQMWGAVRDQAQFVLQKYAARASVTQANAADALLQKLEALARPSEAVPDCDVFISFAPKDRDLATRLAEEIRKHDLTSSAGEVTSNIDRCLACVVLVSPSTRNPTSSLSKEWGSILRRSWSEPNLPLFSLKLEPDLESPAFLRNARTALRTMVLGRSRKSLSKAASEIAAAAESYRSGATT
jgi:hypothetical protein